MSMRRWDTCDNHSNLKAVFFHNQDIDTRHIKIYIKDQNKAQSLLNLGFIASKHNNKDHNGN